MNLAEATFTTFVAAPKTITERIEEAIAAGKPEQVIEDKPEPLIVCPHCEVPGSEPVPDEHSEVNCMVCSVCESIWPDEPTYDEEESDLEEALDFLVSTSVLFDVIQRNAHAWKLGPDIDNNISELKTDIDKFLELFPWKDD